MYPNISPVETDVVFLTHKIIQIHYKKSVNFTYVTDTLRIYALNYFKTVLIIGKQFASNKIYV